VGAIRSFENNSTAANYQLEDGTGLVDVKQWLGEEDSTAQQELRAAVQKDHLYVKVVGTIKEYNGARSILAASIRPLSTGNELAHHFLEVVFSGEKYKQKGTIVQPASPMMGITSSSGGVGFSGSGGSGSGSKRPMMVQGGRESSGDGLRDTVMKFIQEHGESMDVGVSIQSCMSYLPQHSEAEMRSAIDHLAAEGMIYSTVNDDTFKSAN